MRVSLLSLAMLAALSWLGGAPSALAASRLGPPAPGGPITEAYYYHGRYYPYYWNHHYYHHRRWRNGRWYYY